MPLASRLTLARSRRNKRRAAPIRERLPELKRTPGRVADACGRAVRRAAPALALVAVASGIGAGVWAGYHFLTTSSRFAVTEVTVTGAHTLTPDAIRARLPATLGQNIFRTDLAALEHTLEREPWIADATVRRRLPHTIAIDVRERTAAAVVQLDGLYLADADGRVFKRVQTAEGEGSGLPVVTGITRAEYGDDPAGAGERIRGALAALGAWRADATRPAVGEIRVDSRHGVTLYTFDEAVAVRLGDADDEAQLAVRLRRFDAAWAALSPDERHRARAIHLDLDTRPEHVTVAFAP